MHVWMLYRILVAVSMFVLLILGGYTVTISSKQTVKIHNLIERRDHDWTKTNLTDADVPQGLRRVDIEIPNTNIPLIPTVYDKNRSYRWPVKVAIKLTIIGACMIGLSLFGIYTVYDARNFFIVMMVVSTIALIISQLYITHSHLSDDSSYHTETKKKIESQLSEYKVSPSDDVNSFTIVMNSAMVRWQCCGVRGPADFLSRSYIIVWPTQTSAVTTIIDSLMEPEDTTTSMNGVEISHNNRSTVQMSRMSTDEMLKQNLRVLFPPACCKRETLEQGFDATMECAVYGDTDLINERGCYETVYEDVLREQGRSYMNSLIFVISVEVFLTILTSILALMPKDFEQEAAKIAIQYAELIEKESERVVRLSDMKNQENRDAANEETTMMNTELASLVSTDKADGSNKDVDEPLARRLVFVPYAKISSLSSMVMHHSTEIW